MGCFLKNLYLSSSLTIMVPFEMGWIFDAHLRQFGKWVCLLNNAKGRDVKCYHVFSLFALLNCFDFRLRVGSYITHLSLSLSLSGWCAPASFGSPLMTICYWIVHLNVKSRGPKIYIYIFIYLLAIIVLKGSFIGFHAPFFQNQL